MALKATLAWLPALLLGGVSLLLAGRWVHDHHPHQPAAVTASPVLPLTPALPRTHSRRALPDASPASHALDASPAPRSLDASAAPHAPGALWNPQQRAAGDCTKVRQTWAFTGPAC